MSPRFTLDRQDLKNILEVLAWSVASAVVAALITLVASLQVAPQYLFLVPLANTVLYSLQQFLKGNAPK